MTRGLLGQGLDIYPLTPGEETSTHVQQKRPDLILLDCSVDSLTIRSIYRSLKQDEWTRGIPLIALIPEGGTHIRSAGHGGGFHYDALPW